MSHNNRESRQTMLRVDEGVAPYGEVGKGGGGGVAGGGERHATVGGARRHSEGRYQQY